MLRLEVLEQRQMLTVYTVDDPGDSGTGTLCWAIEQANQHYGRHDEIEIAADITQINVTSAQLPAIAIRARGEGQRVDN